ncbi:MAG: Carboxypeptidase regulatory-like protein, partial [Myxococcales bacterium]|nr:Carboxypeptidase regulatory-like protein [Myxococcales bacterium]
MNFSAAVGFVLACLPAATVLAAPSEELPTQGISLNDELGPTLAAARPRDVMHPMFIDPQTVPALVNSHILFINPCMPSGCHVTSGNTDSRTDKSDIGQGTLTAYPWGAASWAQVVACMKATMAPFNITVTDVDPGNVPHFEVMIAGSPGQLGLPQGVGGIADYSCQSPGQCSSYIPNALVFDFTQVWGGSVNEDCATAAQEIAHAWTLDHVVDPSDP